MENIRNKRPRMERLDLYITRDQLAKLEIESDDTYSSIASIVRKAIDQYYASKKTDDFQLEVEMKLVYQDMRSGKITMAEMGHQIELLKQIDGKK